MQYLKLKGRKQITLLDENEIKPIKISVKTHLELVLIFNNTPDAYNQRATSFYSNKIHYAHPPLEIYFIYICHISSDYKF